MILGTHTETFKSDIAHYETCEGLYRASVIVETTEL